MPRFELTDDEQQELGTVIETLVLKARCYPPEPSEKKTEGEHHRAFGRLAELLVARTKHFAAGLSLEEHFTRYFLAEVIRRGIEGEEHQDRVDALKMGLHLVMGGDYSTPAFQDELESVYRIFEDEKSLNAPRWDPAEPAEQLLSRNRELRNNYARFAVVGGWPDKHALRPRDKWYKRILREVTKQVEQNLTSSVKMRDLWLDYTYEFANKFVDGFIPAGRTSWGPNRDGYKYDFPAPEPVLNTCRDHPVLGPSMYFFDVYRLEEGKPVGPQKSDHLALKPGGAFRCVITISDETPGDMQGAQDVRVLVRGPATVIGAARLIATISSANTAYRHIRDRVLIALTHPQLDGIIRLLGPVKLYDKTLGEALAFERGNDIFTLEGALLPEAPVAENGRRHIRQVYFDAIVDYPDFEVTAAVRRAKIANEDPYSDHILVEPGDLLDVQVRYENTGTVKQKAIQLVLSPLPLPIDVYTGIVQIERSTAPGTAVTAGEKLGGGRVPTLGDTAPREVLTATFQLKVRDESDGSFAYRPGVHWLRMTDAFRVRTENGSKSAGLDVLIYAEHGTETEHGQMKPDSEPPDTE